MSSPEAEVPIRPASTVVMLRRSRSNSAHKPRDGVDSDQGFEIFMVRRSPRSEFVGGAFVFPGGALDPSDSDLSQFVFDVSDEEASLHLGLDSGGLVWYAAGARELFEEAGVLLAVDPTGSPINPSLDSELAADLRKWRRRLNAKESTFAEALASLGIFLDVRQLHFFSHWITPPGQPRRYDTRFFLCEMPAAQEPVHDGTETTDSVWISPQAALEAAAQGRMTIIFPTLKNLELLASKGDIDETVAWAKDHTPRVVRPRVALEAGSIRILVPGDPGYEEAEEAG